MQRKEKVEMHLLTTNFLGIYQKFWVEGLIDKLGKIRSLKMEIWKFLLTLVITVK